MKIVITQIFISLSSFRQYLKFSSNCVSSLIHYDEGVIAVARCDFHFMIAVGAADVIAIDVPE